ncbi:hypothetical protein PVK06_027016 [Gossypium arboreum]|uniref:Uncharacterized protein n=1 Tax=Gossypium arboreum TaxID=29729 RepID=A0ABR0P2P4_GOSAR|nr:hypothetical protein PVK06_027016 [Gossypium arboreum]
MLRPISKHVILRSIDYWWIDSFQLNRRSDLALIMFNNIIKVIGMELTNTITLSFGTYLSSIFKKLKIPTRGDPPITYPTPLGFGAFRHMGYRKDPYTGAQIKGGPLEIYRDEDKDMGEIPDLIPTQEHAPPPMPTPTKDQTFSTDTLSILGVINALNDEF